MTTTSHRNCTHPATKTARAACRKARAAHAATIAREVDELITSYYDNTRDGEEIIAGLRGIDPAITEGYYNGDLDIEEIIAGASNYI
jgi:hypothetical protein